MEADATITARRDTNGKGDELLVQSGQGTLLHRLLGHAGEALHGFGNLGMQGLEPLVEVFGS